MIAMSIRPVMTISLSTRPKLSLMNRLMPGCSSRTALSSGVDRIEVVLYVARPTDTVPETVPAAGPVIRLTCSDPRADELEE